MGNFITRKKNVHHVIFNPNKSIKNKFYIYATTDK